MKILLYNDTYKHVGGAETYCLELLDKLPSMGHEVEWLAHGDDSPREKHHDVLPDYNKGRFNYLVSKYFFNPKAYRGIRKKLEEINPDVIHLHHNRYYTFSVMKAIKDLAIPVVQTIHDYTLLCPSQYYPDLYYDTPGTKTRRENCSLICSQGSCLPTTSRLAHPFAHDRKRRRIIKNMPAFIAPSLKLKEYLEKAGFEKVTYLPFFVDEEKWSFDMNRKKKNKVLFIGRVETNKGICLLLDSILKLKKEISDLELVIAGDGSELERIRKKVKTENLEGFVNTVGFVGYDKVNQLYNEANLLVVPSLDMEQFGLIGIEGLASGTAVIGSSTGGIPEWCIHGETGLLFDAGKPETLDDTIRAMLLDDDLRNRLTRKGMEFVKEKYDERKHFSSLLELYRNAETMM